MKNILSLFNGISALHLALDRAGIEINTCYYAEIDKHANKITEQHYPNDVALGDVTKWREWNIDWSSIDLVGAGFPCFTAETLVLTDCGYKPISQIQLGDLVLTHTNSWKPVTDLFEKENQIWEVKAQGMVMTNTTEEHPFLISRVSKKWDKLLKRNVRVFADPEWIEVKDLNVGDFVCYPKIKDEENPLNLTEEDCYILGRYIADGHTRKGDRTEKGRESDRIWSLVLSVGSHKIPKIETPHTLHQHTKNTHRLVFSNKRLVQIAEEHCGCGEKEKFISPTLLKLPKNLLKILLDGILDGDGSVSGGVYKLTSVSLKLINSLNLAVIKVYNTLGNVVYTKRPSKTVIEGRVVNQSDTYTIQFNKVVSKSSNFTDLGEYIAAPIKLVNKTDHIDKVFNIEVSEDNSYTVNNCIVHNCQAWSVAGKQLGDKDERGMLFWTTLEIIAHVLKHNPEAKFLMENVKMKKDFEQYITHHTEQALGRVEKTLINSALVSAQNRQRYYWTNFEVTQPEDKGILLRDIIEGQPDVKFNLSNQRIQTIKKSRTGGVFIDPSKKDKIGTLIASYHKIPSDGNYIIQAGAIRGRYLVDGKRQDHKMETAGLTEQRLEVRKDEKTNTFTTVQKDNVVVRATVQANAEHTYSGKVPTLTASMGVGGGNVPLLTDSETASRYKGKYIDKNARLEYRKLTPLECERLQTFPDNWTDSVSNTQRYKALGNAWTVDVIVHILKCL